MDPVIEKLTEVMVSQREILTNQANQQKLLEKHSELLESQGQTLLRNTVTVEDHARRSDLLEEEQKLIRKDVDQIKSHVDNVKGIGKLIRWVGYIGVVISGAYAALKLWTGK